MSPIASDGQLTSTAARFEPLADALADYAIYLLDGDGFITSSSSGAERLKGYRADEIIGKHFSRFFTAEDRETGVPEQMLEKARRFGRYESEGWRICKDGRRFWADTILQTVRDERGALIGFTDITRDITERAAAQRALLESESRFRLLVDSVIDYAICMLDPSGVVVNWNSGAERLTGYTADEIIGQHFSKFYTKEDRGKAGPTRALETTAREGRYETEGWRVRKDGSRFRAAVVMTAIHNARSELVGFAKVTRDITERHAAQEALRESERQFRLLIAGVTDYAIFMLDPNGIVTSWNAGAERIKGYGSEEIIGRHFSRFYTEHDRAAGLPARALATAAAQGRVESEGWRVRKDGSLFWANAVIDAIHDENGRLIGFAKITRDATERRDAQLALHETQKQRAHAQKIEALGQLTGGVAHDFNNLLMVVSGHIQTLKRGLGDDPKMVRAAEAIELAARRGQALTRQLLTFSRRQAINPTVLDLGQNLEALRSMLASSLGGAARLAITVDSDIWPVKVDASELELALVNVVLNARDAMPSGGVIAIHAENVTLARGDTPANLEGEFVALRISDTGSGIAPDVLPKVFDPFFTTKDVNKGSGLGLSQVHGFAHQSGGTVAIDSEVGRGTTVSLYLPRAREGRNAAESDAIVERGQGGRILLVEDNPEVLEVSLSMLEQLGYEVHAVGDAAAALKAIATQSFDLVVSDIVMPGAMDGIALARAVREKANLPVLLVTGYGQAAVQADEQFKVMRKPYQLSDLSRTVARLIAESKQPPDSNIVRLRTVRPAAGAGSAET